MKLIFIFLGLSSIIATVLPIIHTDEWWIRIFDFPRILITYIATIALLGYLFFLKNKIQDYVFLILMLAAILYQSYMIYPYTYISPIQVEISEKNSESDTSISLLISNVLMKNRNFEKYLGIIKDADPDVIFVAEIDNWWENRLRKIENEYPFIIKYPLDNTYGMSLYSKLELIDPQVKFLVEKDVPSIHALLKLKSGDLIQLHFLHPKPPSPEEATDTTERDAELLIVGKMTKNTEKPVIVAGDLNDVAWSHTTRLFQRISGLLDPRIGRGFYNTYHAKHPIFRWPLDHVFHSDHFKLIKMKRLANFGSDHFPVYIQLNYEVEAEIEQEAPPKDQGDEREAQEKIDKGK